MEVVDSPKYDITDLLYLMKRLRTPETGCAWDLEQSYASITPSTIEEAYEVVDAIQREDFVHLKEELGDLLFQVIFYTRLAEEDELFDFSSVVDTLTAKLVRRHPHVFPEGTLTSAISDPSERESAAVLKQWEQIKSDERKEKGQGGVLDDVPLALPSLQRAQKMQKRVAKAGMDWRSVDAALKNLESEIAELREAISEGDAQTAEGVDVAARDRAREAIADEMGDVLFSCVNVARKLKLDSDQVLRQANTKFERRIGEMEAALKADNVKAWDSLSDEALLACWQQAKQRLAHTD